MRAKGTYAIGWTALICIAFLSVSSCTLLADTPCQTTNDCPEHFFCFAKAQCLPLKWLERIEKKKASLPDSGADERPIEPVPDAPTEEQQSEPSCNNECNPNDKPRRCYPNGQVGCNLQSGQCQGICSFGEQSCVQQNECHKWGECKNAVSPDQEVCDNMDNNCDGEIDEGCDCKGTETRSCYSPPTGCVQQPDSSFKCEGTCQVGTQSCANGKWESCKGAKGPEKESCDNEDNDCDGQIDNGLTQNCYTGPPGTEGQGPCKGGTQTCIAGKWSPCSNQIVPTKDVCNAKDDDCDGQIDEDCIITTLAGNGGPGSRDGVGILAQFHYPSDIAMDTSGNLFVADSFNHLIRKIEPNGAVTYIAGSTLKGYRDGPAKAAQFDLPSGIAIDKNDNIYIADSRNNRLRKLDNSTGMVSTVAGDGQKGFQDGLAASAQFNGMGDLSLDLTENILMVDYLNHRIRKYDNGVVYTLAGTGTPGYKDGLSNVAQLNFPFAIALDSLGNIYFADADNYRIRKRATNGMVTTIAGTGTAGYKDGPALQAEFRGIGGLAFDKSGNLFFSDNNRIRKLDTFGVVTTVAGTGKFGLTNGPSLQAEFSQPTRLVFDAVGNLYILDYANHSIRKMTFP